MARCHKSRTDYFQSCVFRHSKLLLYKGIAAHRSAHPPDAPPSLTYKTHLTPFAGTLIETGNPFVPMGRRFGLRLLRGRSPPNSAARFLNVGVDCTSKRCRMSLSKPFDAIINPCF